MAVKKENQQQPAFRNIKGLVPFILEEDRINSFDKGFKVKKAPLCVPSNFASAGFYSIAIRGAPDAVKCFACARELSDWEPGDDPWEEHVRRGATCPFVQYKNEGGNTVADYFKLVKEAMKASYSKAVSDIDEGLKE